MTFLLLMVIRGKLQEKTAAGPPNLRLYSLRHRPQKTNYGLRNAADNLVQWRSNYSKDLGKCDVTHLMYVKIKLYINFSVVLAKMAWFQTFSSKVSNEIKFQNDSKRQIKIIYFNRLRYQYVTVYKIIAGG